MIKTKRAYDEPSPEDGRRVLVDKLWPRGLTKERARIDEWLKELAPSTELRKWYSHDPAKWKEFKKRYRAELKGKEALLDALKAEALKGNVTLVFSSRETELNNAEALKEFLAS